MMISAPEQLLCLCRKSSIYCRFLPSVDEATIRMSCSREKVATVRCWLFGVSVRVCVCVGVRVGAVSESSYYSSFFSPFGR